MCYYSSAGQSVRIVGTSTHVIIDKHVCMYIHVGVRMHTRTYMYATVKELMDTRTYAHTYDIHMYVHMYTYVRTYVCTYICTYIQYKR